MPLVYRDYAGKINNSSLLDMLIDEMNHGVDKHLTKIAKDLDNLDELTAQLGLRNQVLRDLEKSHQDCSRQRSELLRAWKKEHGAGATYAELLRVCVETNNAEAATAIITLLNAPSDSPRRVSFESTDHHTAKMTVTRRYTFDERVTTVPERRHSLTNKCPDHKEKNLKYFCTTCKELICSKCCKNNEKHSEHDVKDLKSAFETRGKEVESSLINIEGALKKLHTHSEDIAHQQESTEQEIEKTTTLLCERLATRKVELTSQLQKLAQAKKKVLLAQREEIEAMKVQLSSQLDFMNSSKMNGQKALQMKQGQQLLRAFGKVALEPSAEADFIFSNWIGMTTECQDYGQISAGPPDPSKCHANMKDTKMATVGTVSTAVLEVQNFKSQPCQVSICSITCKVVSDITGQVSEGNVKHKEKNQYEINYQPSIKGRQQIHIKVEGQHINGSPYTTSAISSGETFSTPIQVIKEVKGPQGIAVSQKGEVLVAEGDERCITIFSPSGEKLRSFGSDNTSQEQLKFPAGVTIDSDDNVLVADIESNTILKFNLQGDLLNKVGGTGASNSIKLSFPRNVALNASNGYLYSANRTGRIKVLKSDFTFVSEFGGRGSGDGEFNSPQNVACDSTGKVYVADRHNHRIQVFTAEGKFLTAFGTGGQNKGQLKEPCAIAIDSSDRLFICEWANHRVSVFSLTGEYIMSFGKSGNKPGQFNNPRGIAVDSYGVVYVTDGNNRVQVF